MISGSHVIVYSRDAEADRSFFRDVLRLPSVDAGGGSDIEDRDAERHEKVGDVDLSWETARGGHHCN